MGFTYNWNVTKNGNALTSGYGPDISFTPDTAGDYQVSVTGTDGDGVSSDAVTQNVTVTAAPSNVSIIAGVPMASESSQSPGEFTFTRDGDTTAALTVNVWLYGGTVGADYTVSAGAGCTLETYGNYLAVIFTPGSATATVEVTPLDTSTAGGCLAVSAALSADPSYVVDGNNSSATVTINYDDLPTVSIVATGSEAEESGGETGEFTVSRTGPNDEPLLVSYTIAGSAVNGQDYDTIAGNVVIPAYSSTATIPIDPLNVGLTSGSRSVVLTLASGSQYVFSLSASSDTVTIDENDGTSSAIGPWASDEVDSEGADSSASPYVLDLTAAGVFYITDAFIPGDIYKVYDNGTPILTTTICDNSHSGDESYSDPDPSSCWDSPYFAHGQVSLAAGSHSLTIQDTTNILYPAGFFVCVPPTSPTPTLGVGDTAAVAGDTETFNVTLSQKVGYSVSVPYQTEDGLAVAGTDYTAASGTLTFSPGQIIQTVTVPTQLDPDATGDLNFTLALGAPTVGSGGGTVNGAGSTGTGVIEQVTGGLGLYDNGELMPHSADLTPGGLVMLGAPESLKNAVPMLISVDRADDGGGNLQLTYSSKLEIYEQNGTPIGPGTLLPFATTTVYVTGFATSSSLGDADVYLNYVMSGSENVPLDHAIFTVASVKLNSITFTSNYQVNSANGMVNGVNVASTFADDGAQPPGADWFVLSTGPGLSYAIAQTMNTTVSLSANVTVLPAGLSYTLGGDGTMNLPWYGDCMSFQSGTETGSGAISLSGDSPLPNSICNIQSHVMWNISINGWNVSSDVGVTENPVFVTYAMPTTANSTLTANAVTDMRLARATSICSGCATVFDAAAAIQTYLARYAPWGAYPNGANNAPTFWNILDSGGNKGQCASLRSSSNCSSESSE